MIGGFVWKINFGNIEAQGAAVRLIEGINFAKMIIDTGVNSINDVIKITD